MKRTRVVKALHAETALDQILIKGWVRTRRDAKDFSFLEVNDGSCLKNIQIIIDESVPAFAALKDVNTGAAVAVEGKLAKSPGKGQKWEVHATDLNLLGPADPYTYPLQKKRHSDEYLRTIAHLRPRTNKYGALYRIRSESAYAIHQFFRDRGFYYLHTPIITGSDCEGAGELFRVTTLPVDSQGEKQEALTSETDFFGKEASLAVSGQLQAELAACALSDVYTFGPTFRAENSNTPRHVAEFWMVEPEMAFADLQDNMDLGENLIKNITMNVMDHCREDIELFARFVDKKLMQSLDTITGHTYERVSYTEAVNILTRAKKQFEFPVKYGLDLQTEHERYLCEERFPSLLSFSTIPKRSSRFTCV